MWIKKLKIGNVELENNIILAPMAGITDRPFRIVTKKYGPGMTCTEMVSSKGLFYNDEKTKLLLNTKDEKKPISMQIFGNEPEVMANAAEYVSKIADIVDINMGCPAPKIVKNGEGSKLLLNLQLVGKIVNSVVQASKVPVTVKIRKGWDDENVVAVEAAKIIEQAGASAITIHGRTRTQFYSGKADWDIIKKVKESVKIPVIGNGDIYSPQTALNMFEYTNVDGIMVGRASLGEPWLFKQIIDFLQKNEIYKPSNSEKLETIIEHVNLEVEEKGESTGIKELRKVMSAYIKNMPNATTMRQKINTIETKKELIEEITTFWNNNY